MRPAALLEELATRSPPAAGKIYPRSPVRPLTLPHCPRAGRDRERTVCGGRIGWRGSRPPCRSSGRPDASFMRGGEVRHRRRAVLGRERRRGSRGSPRGPPERGGKARSRRRGKALPLSADYRWGQAPPAQSCFCRTPRSPLAAGLFVQARDWREGRRARCRIVIRGGTRHRHSLQSTGHSRAGGNLCSFGRETRRPNGDSRLRGNDVGMERPRARRAWPRSLKFDAS